MKFGKNGNKKVAGGEKPRLARCPVLASSLDLWSGAWNWGNGG